MGYSRAVNNFRYTPTQCGILTFVQFYLIFFSFLHFSLWIIIMSNLAFNARIAFVFRSELR